MIRYGVTVWQPSGIGLTLLVIILSYYQSCSFCNISNELRTTAGRPGRVSARFPANQGARDSIMPLDQRVKFDIKQSAFLYAHPSIDHAQVNACRLAEDQRCRRIVHGASSKCERI